MWLTTDDVERMARALGATTEAFVRRHVRDVIDPRNGQRRMALREHESGRCALLVGKNNRRAIKGYSDVGFVRVDERQVDPQNDDDVILMRITLQSDPQVLELT